MILPRLCLFLFIFEILSVPIGLAKPSPTLIQCDPGKPSGDDHCLCPTGYKEQTDSDQVLRCVPANTPPRHTSQKSTTSLRTIGHWCQERNEPGFTREAAHTITVLINRLKPHLNNWDALVKDKKECAALEKYLSGLDRLDLSASEITDIRPLTSLHVKYLDLSHNEISDLSPLEHTNGLDQVDVSFNRLSEYPSLRQSRIKEINLSGNLLTKKKCPLANSRSCRFDAPPQSCLDVQKMGKDQGDGQYEIMNGKKIVKVYCNMSVDMGGWTLVTKELLGEEDQVSVKTTIDNTGQHGGVVVHSEALALGCGKGPDSASWIPVAIEVPWTKIRYTQQFASRTICYRIFGMDPSHIGRETNLIPWKAGDPMLYPKNMGADHNRDGFTGKIDFCTTEHDKNFWFRLFSASDRYASVVLRRVPGAKIAGIATVAGCTAQPPDPPTSWNYRDIYVR